MSSPQSVHNTNPSQCEVVTDVEINQVLENSTIVAPDDLARSTNGPDNSRVITLQCVGDSEPISEPSIVAVTSETVISSSSGENQVLVPPREPETAAIETAVVSMHPHRDATAGRISQFPGLNFTRQFILDRNRHYNSEARSFRENLSNVFQDFQNPTRLSSWIPNSQHFGFRVAGTNSNGPATAHSSTQHSDSFVINVMDDATVHNMPPSAILTEINATNASLRRSELNERQHRLEASLNETGASTVSGPLGAGHQQHHFERQNSSSSTNNSNNNNNNGGDGGGDGVQDTLSQMPEARAMLNTIGRYMPYMFILLAKACYDHMDGILDFFAFFITFSHANWVVRQEISKQQQRRFLPLLRELFYIFAVIIIIGYMFERKNLFISLVFASSFENPFTLKHLLFSVAITDLVLKLLTVAVKILITMLPPSIVDYKGRGRIFLMTEAISQLYRALAPIQPWLVFLLDSYEGTEKIMGVILSAAYMVAKGSDLLTRAKFCKRAFVKLLQKVSFGNQPTKEQLQSAGGTCPICHDSYNSPVLLECSHIFCELCVGTWFDREQTCPLCRRHVVEDPAYRDGSTTFFLQLY